MVRRPGVGVAENLRRRFLLVATNADANNVAIVVAHRKLKDFLCGVGAKLPDSIEDPEQRDAEIARATGAAAIQAFKDGSEILLAPQADSDRDVNLGVQHVFFFQTLHQPVGDQFVIVRSSQVFGDVLERKQEARKILVAVKRIDLSSGGAFAMALPQLEESCRLDRTLEMQVQFSLGKKAQKTIRRPIESGGGHLLIVDSWRKICEESLAPRRRLSAAL